MKPVRFRVIREAAARIKHMVTWGSKEDDGNGNRAGRHHPILTRGVIVLVLAGIIVGVSLIVASPQEGHLDTGVARATASDVRLLVVGGDGSIDIPPGSPLRQQLVIRAVELKDVAQTLDFPAVVEADPATTAKLSPPLAGRIVELRVGLGDRVQKGQIVAVLKSADLAQAYNDYDKAQSALALARRTLDRQRGLTAIRAGATKDLEAAQDTFTQAEAESRRAAARLDQIGAPATARGAGEGLLNITAPVSGTVTDLSAARGTYFN
ncbi:MAG TPA: efflux RND transporter periplasmic adaptor subunit, partial [Bradyrhizobium sp.]|nr:efflux RND transporter periplasmic adaptor subunit [Bradyrhizobium sp.]